MIKLLVLPEVVYNQYKADGVQLSKLLDIDYMISVSSVSDLLDIDKAMDLMPDNFIEDNITTKVTKPFTAIASLAMSDDISNYTYKALYKKLEARADALQLNSLVTPNREYGVHTLYPIDEYFWVVVQKSLPDLTSDPITESINSNHTFLNDMVKGLMSLHSFESVAATNVFSLFLKSKEQ